MKTKTHTTTRMPRAARRRPATSSKAKSNVATAEQRHERTIARLRKLLDHRAQTIHDLECFNADIEESLQIERDRTARFMKALFVSEIQNLVAGDYLELIEFTLAQARQRMIAAGKPAIADEIRALSYVLFP